MSREKKYTYTDDIIWSLKKNWYTEWLIDCFSLYPNTSFLWLNHIFAWISEHLHTQDTFVPPRPRINMVSDAFAFLSASENLQF